MRNAKLDESQTGIKIVRKNVNNLRYADNTTLMAEIEEEVKRLFMRVIGKSLKAGLKLNIQKMKIKLYQTHHFMGNRRDKSESSDKFYFGGLQNHCRW